MSEKRLAIWWQTRDKDGSCNFCTDQNSRMVFEIRSNEARLGLTIRMCLKCKDELCRADPTGLKR